MSPFSERDRRQRWFDAGAEALRAIAPAASGEYVCPLCLRRFPPAALEDDWLTVDHAPPEALGGKPAALTCKECNNRGGSELEIHMIRLDAHEAFLQGEDHRPLSVRIIAEDAVMNGELRWSAQDQAHHLVGDPGRNHPDAPDASMKVLEGWVRGTAEEREFTLTLLERVSPRRAAIGWMRSAYLIAFGFFGYRYIFRPALKPIREQIAEPAREIVRPATMWNPAGRPGHRLFFLIREPEVLRGAFAACMGRHTVLLPGLDLSHDSFQAAVEESRRLPPGAKMTGDVLRWPPGGPRYGLDLRGRGGPRTTQN